jgi:hypothetical protein
VIKLEEGIFDFMEMFGVIDFSCVIERERERERERQREREGWFSWNCRLTATYY